MRLTNQLFLAFSGVILHFVKVSIRMSVDASADSSSDELLTTVNRILDWDGRNFPMFNANEPGKG